MTWSQLMKDHLTDNTKTDNIKSEVLSIDENELKIQRYNAQLLKKAQQEFYPRSYHRARERIGEY